ncbi:MAG: hypothetical protein ACREJ9_10895 [Candidatus Rokuibacteriota bacterium]
MSPEYTYWDEKRRARVGRTYVLMVLGGLVVGLAAGGVGAWLWLKPSDLRARLEGVEARIGAVESGWPERFNALESKIQKLRVEMAIVGRRAEEFARLIAEMRAATPSAAARRPRPEREGAPAAPAAAPAALRLSGVINSQGTRAALLEDGRDHAYVVQVGGALPEGRVVDISDDAVVIETISGRSVTIRLPQ